MSGKFYPLNCSIRQKPSTINGTFLLWWMRKSVEAGHAAIPKEKCGDTNCAIILNWNVDLSLPSISSDCWMSTNIIYGKLHLLWRAIDPCECSCNDMASCLLATIWFHPIVMKQDDMVSDDDMASGSMDHVDRDDDYRLILLTAKCVDIYIHMCDNIIN